MSALDEENCSNDILEIFDEITTLTPMGVAHALGTTSGKLYELYCLARLLQVLVQSPNYCSVAYTGGALVLKQGGGYADPTTPHFEVYHTAGHLVGHLYTDIEVATLGATHVATYDRSHYHEIDLVLLRDGHSVQPHCPSPDQLLFGVECKGTAEFNKAFVREVLGRRRELSYFRRVPLLGEFGPVRADPPSQYWLAYLDQTGDNYVSSPRAFGVELKHWLPSV